MFITFEGPEGGGKTTQIRLLEQTLVAQGQTVLVTREPGGTAIGNAIRQILLDVNNTAMSERAEALLFNAARAQLVDEIIAPA
ncbi:MAG: dTMP kinase, partial [Caldilineaceae bacterium]|nr:dTMP kinase [Caldilineaceae bacterium]